MAEFINRQEAIEQTKAEWAKLPLTETTGFGILMRVLTSIPAADVRPVEWIPVTERLPEVRTWVLCYCRANSFDVFRVTDEGNWQYGNRSIYMKGYVTHWMPLPPAPKEE